MRKRKFVCMFTVLAVAFCSCFLFTGCKGKEDANKKYDVRIKVVNNFESEWVFELGVDKLTYDFDYTGNDMRFWIDSWNLPKHPRMSNSWSTPNTGSGLVFHMSTLYRAPGGDYEEYRGAVKNRGEYIICIEADSTDLWNERIVRLYINVL